MFRPTRNSSFCYFKWAIIKIGLSSSSTFPKKSSWVYFSLSPVFPHYYYFVWPEIGKQLIIVNSEMREECFFMMNIINKTSTFYCNGFACSFIVISDLWVSLIFHIPENRTDNILIPDNEYIMICVINSIDPFFFLLSGG